MKKILLPALAFVTLSACEDIWNREGVGFTGIDGEPRTIVESREAAGFVASRDSVPAELAGLTTPQLLTEETDPAKVAGVAIDNGGRVPGQAVEIGGDRQTLMLSTVSVNNVLYAVLRTPEGAADRMDVSTGPRFAASIPRLTGCLIGGNVYQKGTSSLRTSGFAAPLNCR
ncbi:hypothetical protein [Ruegeria sp. HKCCD8929]|uniref:hypothetical protein n=1 Tax=Ruegeria sp. HKCCD8929 TaxID=2683006 RepID=UPI0014890E71|nr:hypothetical protein [Ruegeria sp. HKCCD8929]